MLKKVLNWLRQLISPRVKIVEVDLTRPRLDPEARLLLPELKSHPGINYFLARVRLQRWYLENQMKTVVYKDLREFDHVQLGSRWLAWVERQLEEMLHANTPKPLTPDAEDIESFIKAQTALELVGQDQ